MNKILLAFLIVGSILLAVSCATKRWSEGDPREATPLPTPKVIATVEINIGTEAVSNTRTGNTP